MKHLFVPYEIALLAKINGFDEFCLTKFEPKLYTKPNGEQILSAIIQTTFLNGVPKHNTNGFEGHRNSIKTRFNDEVIAAPMYQQLIDFFETHSFNIRIYFDSEKIVHYQIFDIETGETLKIKDSTKPFNSKYDAFNDAFIKLFELIHK